MYEEPTETPEFNALMGFILGLLGVIGSAIWYFSGTGTGFGMSGFALVLGIISLIILVWSILAAFFLILASRNH